VQLVKVLVMAVSAAELLLKLALLALLMKMTMILESPLHPYVLFVKFEMKKLQQVQTATADLELPMMVLVFLCE
jgi:hypothetical protein